MRFKNLPGAKIKIIGSVTNKAEPTITIITPFYNGGKTLMETANTIFSQTYPFFEWILIDDGSKDKESLKKLTELEKMDERVKIFHKENGGPSQARDYGLTKANKNTKYIYFLDCDDLIENTMLETLYWTLETHPNGSFAYTSMVNFGDNEYYWEPYLTIEEEKVRNLMCISTMIKKEDLLEVNGFEIKEKAMHEDWNLWLKLIGKGKIPIRTNAPLFWYRTSNTGELSRANKNMKKSMKLIKSTAKKIKQDVEIIQFPRKSETIYTKNNIDKMILPIYKEENTILFILDNATLTKDNIRILENIKQLNKKSYKSIVVTTEPYYNNLRQEIKENCSEFYDLTNFLDLKDYLIFINYLISSRKIKSVLINNSSYAYSIIPILKRNNKNLQIIDLIFTKENNYTIELDKLIDKTVVLDKKMFDDFNKQNQHFIKFKDQKNCNFNPKETKNIKTKLNLPNDKIIVSFIDQLNDMNEIKLFINIAGKITQKNSNMIFLMNGNGILYSQAKNYIIKYNLINKLFLFKEEELSFDDAINISDIIVDCSHKENKSISSYKGLINAKPVIAPNFLNQLSIITNDNGKLISISKDNKINITNYLDEYIEAIMHIFENLTKYQKSSENVALKFNKENKMISNELDIILQEKPKHLEIECDNIITECYLKNINEIFNKQYLNYYDKEHNLIPREGLDLSKKTQIKRKIRTFSIKYSIESEMHFCLQILESIYEIFKCTLNLIKKIIIFILNLVPLTFNVVKIIIRFIRILLSKLKQTLL